MRHIRCFLEAARANSLAEAADRLHISQPAVSKSIKELEEILGVELFDRTARKIVLNDAGRGFQQHAGAAFALLGKAQSTATKLSGKTVKLSVGVLPTAATDLVPRAALAFSADNPDCVVQATTGPNWLLLSQLRESALDLVVGRMALPDQMAGLTFEQLYVEDVVLVARPGHPLLHGTPVDSDLGNYPMILPPSGAVISTTVRSYLLSMGLQNIRPLFQTVSLPFGRRAVQLSDALWFISRGVVADELKSGTLCAIDLKHPMHAGPVGISLRQDAAPFAERDDFVKTLRQIAGSMVFDPSAAVAARTTLSEAEDEKE